MKPSISPSWYLGVSPVRRLPSASWFAPGIAGPVDLLLILENHSYHSFSTSHHKLPNTCFTWTGCVFTKLPSQGIKMKMEDLSSMYMVPIIVTLVFLSIVLWKNLSLVTYAKLLNVTMWKKVSVASSVSLWVFFTNVLMFLVYRIGSHLHNTFPRNPCWMLIRCYFKIAQSLSSAGSRYGRIKAKISQTVIMYFRFIRRSLNYSWKLEKRQSLAVNVIHSLPLSLRLSLRHVELDLAW